MIGLKAGDCIILAIIIVVIVRVPWHKYSIWQLSR